MQPLPRTPPRQTQTSRLFRFDETTTLSLPMIEPRPGDVCNLMLQIDAQGIVNVSCLALIKGPISAYNTASISHNNSSNKQSALREPETPKLLANAPIPPTRIRIIGHTLSESRTGEQFIVYLVEYQEGTAISSSAPSISNRGKAFVASKRFADFYDLHRYLSLTFIGLPPFPARTFIRSVNNDALIKEREAALTVYMQLIAMRADINHRGDLSRFLHNESGAPMTASKLTVEQRERQTESEREREIDSRMKGEEKLATAARLEAIRLSESSSQQYDLLIDQYHVQHTTHIDINAIQEKAENEQELRQTVFTPNKSSASSAAISQATTASTADKTPTPLSKTGPITDDPYAAALIFLTRSPIFTIHRVLLPSPNLLFVCGGDNSTVSKVEVFFSSLFSSGSDKKKKDLVRAKLQEKRDVYVSPEQEAKELRELQEKEREAQYPLGALYAFHTDKETGDFVPTLSLFFEREITDIAWDKKRQWIYVSQDDGQVHVYAPQADDWRIVKKVWTIQLHSKYINQLLFNMTSDALFSISHAGTCSRFDLPSISVIATLSHSTGRLTGIAYDEEFDRIFLACYDRHIYVYDMGRIGGVKKEKLLGTMKGHEGSVRCVDYHSDSGMLVSGGFDQVLILWRVAAPGKESDSKIVCKLLGHTGRVKSVSFDNTGEYIISGDANGHVMVWSRRAAMPIMAFIAHNGPINSVAMRDRLIVTGAEDKSAKVWTLS